MNKKYIQKEEIASKNWKMIKQGLIFNKKKNIKKMDEQTCI